MRHPFSLPLLLSVILTVLPPTAPTAAEKAVIAPAEGAPTTLEDLVGQALADNPELRFYEAEIAAARGERRTAGAWANPELSGEVGRKRTRGESGLSGEGTAWAVAVAQTFEWPGRVSLRKAIAARQVQLAQVGLEQFRAALAAQVRQRGFALYVGQRREAAAREVAARAEELVAVLVQREAAGVAPLLETRALEAAAIVRRREANEASKEARAARLELNLLRGRPVAESVAIAEVPAAGWPELPGVEELIARAARGNFSLRQREGELAQQGFRLRLARNEAWPSVTLQPGVSREEAGGERETIAGINVAVPLPLWNRNAGGVATSRARLLQAQASLRVAQREVERRLREAAALYADQRRELTRLSPRTAEELREAAALADRNYRLGAVPLGTYLEVQDQYLAALNAFFATQADALSALAELELLTGSRLATGLNTKVSVRPPSTVPTVKPDSK